MNDETNDEDMIQDELIDDVGLVEDDYETEQEDEIGSLHSTKYDLPSEVESYVDVGKGSVVDKSNLNHFDVIKAIAEKTGTKIQNPKASCKKCHGRGWIGVDTISKSPVPCSCIYPPQTENEKANEQMIEQSAFPKYNRLQKRKMAEYVQSTMAKRKFNEAKETTQKQVYANKINKAKLKLEQASK